MSEQSAAVSAQAQPPKPIYGSQPVGDPILDAAANCVARKGFDNTSLEEVAQEAGVSRTTLYRRFGNRESLFSAVLLARSEPFRVWSNGILSGPGSLAERLETVLVHMILELQRVGWLDRSLQSGISPLSKRLLKITPRRNIDSGLGLAIRTSLQSRLPDGSPISIEEAMDWLMDQMIGFASLPQWNEDDLRLRVRFFVVPLLIGGHSGNSSSDRFTALEAKLDRILARL